MSENMNDWALVLGIDPRTLPPPPVSNPAVGSGIINNKSGPEVLLEEEFRELTPFLPPEPRSARALTNLQVLNAILWCDSTGRALTHLPISYGNSDAVRKRQERWALAAVGERLLQAMDELPLRPSIKAAIRRCAASMARRGDNIRKARVSRG